jgi:hypothetical protein
LKKGKFVSDIATLVLFDMGIREAWTKIIFLKVNGAKNIL